MSYCATIRISGDLDKTKLQAVIAEIEKTLKQPERGREKSRAMRAFLRTRNSMQEYSPTQKS